MTITKLYSSRISQSEIRQLKRMVEEDFDVVRLEKYNSNNIFSEMSQRFLKAFDDYIGKIWIDIKKGVKNDNDLKFMIEDPQGALVTIKPVYGGNTSSVLIERDNGKTIEQALIERKKPYNFIYEKMVPTEFGSATLKFHNSYAGYDKKISDNVDNMIQKYIKQIVPRRILFEYVKPKNRALLI